MRLLSAIVAGLAGSSALTLIHESARRRLPEAPRADILGVRALEKGLFAAGQQPPTGDRMHRLALGTDLLINAAYYALVAAGGRRAAWAMGPGLGLLAGIGAITLPGPLGLGTEPTERTSATRVMTVAWYTIGGIVAALIYRLLTRSHASPEDDLEDAFTDTSSSRAAPWGGINWRRQSVVSPSAGD